MMLDLGNSISTSIVSFKMLLTCPNPKSTSKFACPSERRRKRMVNAIFFCAKRCCWNYKFRLGSWNFISRTEDGCYATHGLDFIDSRKQKLSRERERAKMRETNGQQHVGMIEWTSGSIRVHSMFDDRAHAKDEINKKTKEEKIANDHRWRQHTKWQFMFFTRCVVDQNSLCALFRRLNIFYFCYFLF